MTNDERNQPKPNQGDVFMNDTERAFVDYGSPNAYAAYTEIMHQGPSEQTLRGLFAAQVADCQKNAQESQTDEDREDALEKAAAFAKAGTLEDTAHTKRMFAELAEINVVSWDDAHIPTDRAWRAAQQGQDPAREVADQIANVQRLVLTSQALVKMMPMVAGLGNAKIEGALFTDPK